LIAQFTRHTGGKVVQLPKRLALYSTFTKKTAPTFSEFFGQNNYFLHQTNLLFKFIPAKLKKEKHFAGNTKGGSITVLLTSCLTGLD